MIFKETIEEIKKDIAKYSPYPDKVKVVAVTKYSDVDTMRKFIDENQDENKVILGENKVQVIREKIEHFKNNNLQNKKIEWHFIGNLQKNKVKYIINDIELIHSVNKLSLAQEINKRAEKIKRLVEVLIEINIYGEESKQGYDLETFEEEIDEYFKLKNIKVIGLMTMAPLGSDEKIQREVFSKLRLLKDELNEKYFNDQLIELSMGMSGDYKIALQEGSTFIRLGSRIFL